jgi:hypothetical protein
MEAVNVINMLIRDHTLTLDGEYVVASIDTDINWGLWMTPDHISMPLLFFHLLLQCGDMKVNACYVEQLVRYVAPMHPCTARLD